MTGLDLAIALTLDDFSLAIAFDAQPGETIAIVGPNGAGKSSTVRALAGLSPIDAGHISIGDVMVDAPSQGIFVPPHERRVGIAFQDGLLFPHLRARDNVAFGLDADRQTRRARAEEWLALVGLEGYGNRRVTDLSGGEARRVAVARALITKPDLVVLDEPFAGLDVGARQVMRRVLAEQLPINNGVSILVTHDPADAHALADRIVALEGGGVSQIGTPNDIRSRPTTKYLADLVGVNLIEGAAEDGMVAIGDELDLAITDRSVSGEVVLTVAPSAVALHADRPSGSPRNTWRATVVDVFSRGDVVRVQLEDPLAIVADVTPGAIDDLNIEPGQPIWVAIKATSFDYRQR